MSVQTSIERKLRKGVIGAIADSSLKRGNPLRVDAGTSSVKATLAATIATNPAANDTITIGGQVYKFVSSLAAANDVKIGSTAADTATNLGNAINKGTGEGTTYGTGTVANASVSATVASAVITLSAKDAGFAGNLIKVETSVTAKITFTGNYLTGGIDEKFPASVGRAYTYDTTDGVAKMGGTGAFAGIMVGPSEYANWNNLFDTLCVPNGTPADLIKFGRVWVRVTGAVSRGDVPCFKQSDGSFVGVASSPETSAPTGYTKLDKAVFTVAADAGDIAVIELSY